MKRHLFTLEIATFSVILLIFIIPPFFAQPVSSESTLFSQWSFPLAQLIMACFAVLLCILFYEPEKKWLKLFPGIFSVCLLFCNALLLKGISVFMTGQDAGEITVELPENLISWCFCILNFLLAGFYEEVLYRMYFPEALVCLLGRKFNGKWLKVVCELTGCLAFAFAHLYLGWLAVINAAIAHLILRWCFKSSGIIWAGVGAHFVYNLISLILL